MNDENITRVKIDPDNLPPIDPETLKWLDEMTEEEVHAAALSDPDAQPLTEEQLKFMYHATPLPVRKRLGITQEQFAKEFHLAVGTVRDWEQCRYFPDQAARTLMQLIDFMPETVRRVLNEEGDTHLEVHLTEEMKDFVREQAESERFDSPSDVVDTALRLLRDQERSKKREKKPKFMQ